MQEKRSLGRLCAGHEVGQAIRGESLWQEGKVLLPGLSIRELFKQKPQVLVRFKAAGPGSFNEAIKRCGGIGSTWTACK